MVPRKYILDSKYAAFHCEFNNVRQVSILGDKAILAGSVSMR